MSEQLWCAADPQITTGPGCRISETAGIGDLHVIRYRKDLA